MAKRSHRVPGDLSPNRLTEIREEVGTIPFDLTLSNPTQCGVVYPSEIISTCDDPAVRSYRPEPRGPRSARRAVAAHYRRWDLDVNPDLITLTASTSEAYGFLFRLVCDPGDAVFVPTPSYPLFDQLARLDGIEGRPYNLDHESGWRINFSDLERAPHRVRAVVVVHPNNPTGSFVHPEDADRLVALCRRRQWALIADEVFLDYPLDGGPGAGRSFASIEKCLCFALGGLSKLVGLPQLKLSWIITTGPDDLVARSVEGLDYIADTYLSVSTPIALSAPAVLEQGEVTRTAINRRCRANLETLRRRAAAYPALKVLNTGGGWSAVIQIPAVEDEEELCLRLLTEIGVAVHPGYFYDFPREGFLVVSLLTPEPIFDEGILRTFSAVAAGAPEDGHGSG